MRILPICLTIFWMSPVLDGSPPPTYVLLKVTAVNRESPLFSRSLVKRHPFICLLLLWNRILRKENLCPWQLQLIAAKAAIRRSDMSPDHLRIVDLGYPKGRGMVANTNIGRGEYVTYYYGMRDVMEPDVEDNSYTFQIAYRNTRFWVDGSEEDGSYGRLINDEWRHPNLRSGMIFVDGVPHVSFFALRQILEGEEIHFNYGGSEDLLPWRTQENRSYIPV